MTSKIEQAIVKTLTYADVFDYPLTLEEIEKYLIKCKVQSAKCKVAVENPKVIKNKQQLYFLRGRDDIVIIRQRRERWSREKLKIAKKIAKLIHFIPFVKLIGVTGALAVNNSKKDDDIDLMIVTKKGLLWTTRLFVTLLTELLGLRRRPGDIDTNNKICLNMFVDEDHLSIPENERDLFSAHEVVQMRPIWDREQTYQRFLQANLWVREYLPNSIESKKLSSYQAIKLSGENTIYIARLLYCSIASLLNFFEIILKKFQLWYMKKRRTSEVISDGIIRFHPQDARVWVMKKYNKIKYIVQSVV